MWSLSVEMFMNLLFAFIGVTWYRIALIVSIAFTSLSLAVITSTAVNVTSGWIAFSRGVFGFSCGLIARILYNKKISNSRVQIVVSSIIVGVIFSLVTSTHYFLVLVAPSMSFLIYAISGTIVQNAYFKNFCTKCGNFSYGVYLWHFPVNYFVRVLLPTTDSSDKNFLLKIVELAATISVSLALTWIGLTLFKRIALFKIN
jgi:peptidoglycan/LPS O-acetylase OafA/YrhL